MTNRTRGIRQTIGPGRILGSKGSRPGPALALSIKSILESFGAIGGGDKTPGLTAAQLRGFPDHLDGEDGPPGPLGPRGRPGLRGRIGQSAYDGEDGVDGLIGASGRRGVQGRRGWAGMDGADGEDGIFAQSNRANIGRDAQTAVAGAATSVAPNVRVTSEALVAATTYILTLTDSRVTTNSVVQCTVWPSTGVATGIQLASITCNNGNVVIAVAMAALTGTVDFMISIFN